MKPAFIQQAAALFSADVYQSDLALCVSVGFVGGELIYNLWWLVPLCFTPFTF